MFSRPKSIRFRWSIPANKMVLPMKAFLGVRGTFQRSLYTYAMLLLSVPGVCVAGEAEISFQESPGRITLSAENRTIATYVYRDDKTLRPHFANIITTGGVPVTRHHPPREGIDATDHAHMHPGIWLGFGDLGGADFWRNKGRVEHVEFIEKPHAEGDGIAWTVRNRYVDGDRTVCEEVCRHAAQPRPNGWLLTYDSTFQSETPFAFGDQEEMGLGIRVATPLTVKNGGRIINSDGKRNEAEVRGTNAAWCDYGGKVDRTQVGLVLMPHPENFRASWYHARDYGFVAANPFGRNALTGGEKSRVEVAPGKPLRLRYGVLVYAESESEPFDRNAEYSKYTRSDLQVRKRRVLYNLDGDSCMFVKKGSHGPEIITADDLRTIVDEITFPGSQVDTLLVCINAQVMYYPSKVGTMRGTLTPPEKRKDWPASEQQRFKNLQAMFDSGVDPYAVLLEAGRNKNLEVLLTFRMNDNHNLDFLRTAFWRDHPEYRLNGGALDFEHDAVREYVFRLIEETVQRYDADGIELDFQRFPTFFREEYKDVEGRVDKINRLVERVRAMLDAEGRRRGRKLILTARVPSDYGRTAPNYELSRSIGCDPAAWVRNHWVDFLTVSEFLFVRYDLPIKPWKERISGVPIYGGIECVEGTTPRQAMTAEKYRRAAKHLWEDGADGIYLFNFFTTRENGKEAFEPPFEVLKSLGEPSQLE